MKRKLRTFSYPNAYHAAMSSSMSRLELIATSRLQPLPTKNTYDDRPVTDVCVSFSNSQGTLQAVAATARLIIKLGPIIDIPSQILQSVSDRRDDHER